MRLPVYKQREIARLHFYDPSQSNRAIADMFGLAPNTIRSLREKLRENVSNWDAISKLDDDEWCRVVGTDDRTIARRKLAPEWELVHAEMQRPDATLERLWQEWREQCPDGIGYTTFTEGYRKYKGSLHVVMRRTHRPGEKLFVDFAGRTVEVRDPSGGPSTFAQIFIAVMGYSNYTYIRAVKSQNSTDWVQCHIDCFDFLGGVPEWVVPDNLKSAILGRDKEKIHVNPAYRDCLRHYNTATMPTGIRKPRHKAKAEIGVQIAQRWVLFPLRDRIFFSLNELNEELRRRTQMLNAHPFKQMEGTRCQRFESHERHALKPLPVQNYELCNWRYGVRVGDDYHVEHLRSFYSAPNRLCGSSVDLRITATTLEIMFRSRRVAIHSLSIDPGTIVTMPDHRPVAHARVLEGEPRTLLSWAQAVGRWSEQMIRHHLEDRTDATNGLRAARRMRELSREYGEPRFEEACAYAVPLNITSLRSITSILKRSPDKREMPTEASPTRPHHDQIRGPGYYGEIQ